MPHCKLLPPGTERCYAFSRTAPRTEGVLKWKLQLIQWELSNSYVQLTFTVCCKKKEHQGFWHFSLHSPCISGNEKPFISVYKAVMFCFDVRSREQIHPNVSHQSLICTTTETGSTFSPFISPYCLLKYILRRAQVQKPISSIELYA